MRMVLLDGNRQEYSRNYCSAYGLGYVQLIADARGELYLLLYDADGHGTGATGHYLNVYKISAGRPDERGRFLISGLVRNNASWDLDYRTYAPPGGGIVVGGPWRFQAEISEPYIAGFRRQTTLEIDVARSAQSAR